MHKNMHDDTPQLKKNESRPDHQASQNVEVGNSGVLECAKGGG